MDYAYRFVAIIHRYGMNVYEAIWLYSIVTHACVSCKLVENSARFRHDIS